MIAAFLPLPPDPEALDSSEEGSDNADCGRPIHGPMDERRYQSARWWRRLNRWMSLVGLLIIATIVSLSTSGEPKPSTPLPGPQLIFFSRRLSLSLLASKMAGRSNHSRAQVYMISSLAPNTRYNATCHTDKTQPHTVTHFPRQMKRPFPFQAHSICFYFCVSYCYLNLLVSHVYILHYTPCFATPCYAFDERTNERTRNGIMGDPLVFGMVYMEISVKRYTLEELTIFFFLTTHTTSWFFFFQLRGFGYKRVH